MPSLIGNGDVTAANYLKHVINQADVGRELIVSLTLAAMTDEQLSNAIYYITTAHGVAGEGGSAFTVAAVGTADGTPFEAGVTGAVFLRCQGTGDLVLADLDTAFGGVSAIVAVFTPAK